MVAALIMAGMSNFTMAGTLATIKAQSSNDEMEFTAEGVVEAVKTSLIAAQVTGNVTALTVKVGDQVKPGQLLIRVDTRLADQQVISTQAQVSAAKAELSAARSEYERKQHLYEKQYISKAALERAEADFKNAEAQANAKQAQSGMSKVETGMHTLNAPYAGVVGEVMTEIGSMVMPDKPLLSIYDPKAMRVVANVPQSQLSSIKSNAVMQIEFPGGEIVMGRDMTILPLADSVTHVVQIRVSLLENSKGITPGLFARVHFQLNNFQASGHIHIPLKSVIRRSELTAVYVLDHNGRTQLRQVRLGKQQGDNVEISSGLQAGEQVIADPLAAVTQP